MAALLASTQGIECSCKPHRMIVMNAMRTNPAAATAAKAYMHNKDEPFLVNKTTIVPLASQRHTSPAQP